MNNLYSREGWRFKQMESAGGKGRSHRIPRLTPSIDRRELKRQMQTRREFAAAIERDEVIQLSSLIATAAIATTASSRLAPRQKLSRPFGPAPTGPRTGLPWANQENVCGPGLGIVPALLRLSFVFQRRILVAGNCCVVPSDWRNTPVGASPLFSFQPNSALLPKPISYWFHGI